MAKTIPYKKLQEKSLELAAELFTGELPEIKRIVEKMKPKEREIVVAFNFSIDCDALAVKAKISFAEKFSATLSGSVEDPDQLTLDEQKEKKDSAK